MERVLTFNLSVQYTVSGNLSSQTHKEVLLMADVSAPMPGKICEVKVSPGDTVIEDQEVLVLEAMKMEMPIVATAAGTVKSVNCATGDAVQGGDVLVVIE